MLMEVRMQEVMKKEVTTGDTLILTIMYKSTLRYFFVFPCLKNQKALKTIILEGNVGRIGDIFTLALISPGNA